MSTQEPDNTLFIEAMRATASANTPENQRALYEAMLSSVFLLPSPDDGSPAGVKPFQKGDHLHVMTMHLSDQRVAWPLFTDKAAMLRWKTISHYYQFDAIDAFALADKHHVDTLMINPAGPIGGQVASWEIHWLALGEIPDPDAPRMSTRTLDRADVFVAPPAQRATDQMIAATREVMAQHPQVQSAYIFMMAFDPQPPQLVLGVRFFELPDKATKDALMRTLSHEVNDKLAPEKLGLIVLSDKLYNMAMENTEPAYQR
jgi:hypothetical protein